MGGLFTPADWGTCVSTKPAVETIAAALQQELAPYGIKVQTINPGACSTGDSETMADNPFRWLDLRHPCPQPEVPRRTNMKTWFITGASRGFGARIAERALARGDNVVATARDPKAVTERLGAHPNLLAVALDVTNEEQAKAAAAAAVARFGRIDVLLNNAGFGLVGAVEEASAAEVEKLFRTNVFGLLAVTRAVLPQMRAQRSGRILNISSIGGYRGSAGFGVYCATKFAVEGLSEALHAELAPLGIHVTVVEPGYFRTDFLDASSLTASPTSIADYNGTAGTVRQRADSLNHAQPGDPDKLAAVLVEFADAPNPPVRLPLGSDTLAVIEGKHASDAAILSQWRPVSISTDFTAA